MTFLISPLLEAAARIVRSSRAPTQSVYQPAVQQVANHRYNGGSHQLHRNNEGLRMARGLFLAARRAACYSSLPVLGNKSFINVADVGHSLSDEHCS